MAEPDVFEFPVQVRYMEVDAQNVVFNAWYLTYFDEAFTAFLQSRGLGYQALRDGGLTRARGRPRSARASRCSDVWRA